MEQKFLDAGVIVNTHGIRGEVRIQPWTDSPDFLLGFSEVHIGGKMIAVENARVHKKLIIAKLAGVDSVEDAIPLKAKVIKIDVAKVKLDEGQYFVDDLIGLTVIDADSGTELGKLTEVLSLPANDVYVIGCTPEMLIPAVPEFVKEISLAGGLIRVKAPEWANE